MTENVLGAETKKQLPYKVRGMRDGLLFRFAEAEGMPAWQQEKAVFDAVTDKAKTLAPLLEAEGVIEIEGATLGETARIRLEQQVSRVLKQSVCVRLGKAEQVKKMPAASVHYGTVRGGMCLRAEGDLTVVGDVHVGARLVAGGSITVLGALCGAAWAGQKENVRARIAAWQLCASELRIAKVRKQMPNAGNRADKLPEYAYLRDGVIEILQYNTKK